VTINDKAMHWRLPDQVPLRVDDQARQRPFLCRQGEQAERGELDQERVGLAVVEPERVAERAGL
jgi:hypothetical protein